MRCVGLCNVCGGPCIRSCVMCGRPFCERHLSDNGQCPFCTGRIEMPDAERMGIR